MSIRDRRCPKNPEEHCIKDNLLVKVFMLVNIRIKTSFPFRVQVKVQFASSLSAFVQLTPYICRESIIF